MEQYQSTLRDPLEFAGVGLHTGKPGRVRVFPAPAGSGLRFRLEDAVEFPARADFVVDTRRATVLGAGEHTISTVEHLLSALLGMDVDNALIAAEGPEIPVMDGSAKVFADAIAAAGTVVQREPRARFIPTGPSVYRDGDRLLIVLPSASFRVRMTVDYEAPLGTQFHELEVDPTTYATQIAPSRTFGFQHEVEALLRHGLAQGGTLENAVVFGPDGPLAPLRSPDEPCRHKILDLIGDFALLGAYPQCEVVAIKSGHKLHCMAVRELRPLASKSASATAVVSP
ncbi:MAG: UDP-3-O-acyl-N-acetylglucosamine deacetylase [Candidatus Velthaea sp.]